MTTDEMIAYLQGQYGNIGEINKFVPADEGGGFVSYNADPALQRKTEFGQGISNIRPAEFSQNIDPLANEYGVIPSEQTATPTSYLADLTVPDKQGKYFTGKFSASGEMIGAPEEQTYTPDWFRENQDLILAIPGLVAGGAGLLAGGFGGAGGVTAASLGELGLNTALAAGTPGGIASGLSAASLGELGINTALAAGSEGGIAAGTALSGVEAAPSFLDSINLGKTFFPDAPGYVQQGVNRFGTGLVTSGGDPEAAARNALMGGVTDFINPYFAELPKEFQPIARAGVQTALGGGSVEDVLKGAAFGTITSNVSSAITGATGSKWAGEVATNAIKQALTGGNIDPKNITVSTLAQLAGRAVGAETGNESLGRAATTAVLGAIKGKDLDDILKQVAMGALTTPAKKGG